MELINEDMFDMRENVRGSSEQSHGINEQVIEVLRRCVSSLKTQYSPVKLTRLLLALRLASYSTYN